MRRHAMAGIVAGAALVLVTATAVHAHWSVTQTVSPGVVTSGTLEVSAVWKTAPSTTPMFPGEVREGVVTVTPRADGENLRWRLLVTSGVAAPYAGHVDFQAWEGACGTGTPIGPGGTGPYAARAPFDVCVRFTLASNAPGSLQQTPAMSPTVTVNAVQVTS